MIAAIRDNQEKLERLEKNENSCIVSLREVSVQIALMQQQQNNNATILLHISKAVAAGGFVVGVVKILFAMSIAAITIWSGIQAVKTGGYFSNLLNK